MEGGRRETEEGGEEGEWVEGRCRILPVVNPPILGVNVSVLLSGHFLMFYDLFLSDNVSSILNDKQQSSIFGRRQPPDSPDDDCSVLLVLLMSVEAEYLDACENTPGMAVTDY